MTRSAELQRRQVLRWRRHGAVLLLGALAAAMGVAVNLGLFPLLSWNADEGVYLAQAEALRSGQLTWPASSHGDFLRPWLTGEHGGHYFTKYLPGYPALLATATWLTGSPLVVPALSAALLVFASYALTWVLFASRRVALLAAGLTLISPVLVIHSGLYLTYTVTTAVLFLAAACVVRGAERSSRRLLVTGGALGGLAILFRQYDAVLFGAPVAAYVLARYGRPARRAAPLVAWPALGALPALAVVLAYNAAVTGSPLRLPLPATDELDAFGFGPRRMLPTEYPIEFTPGRAADALVAHLAAVPQWVAGGLLLPVLALVALGFGDRERRPQRLLLAALLVVFPVGYFPFWGPALAAELGLGALGPFYYIPALMVLTVLAASGAGVLWTRARDRWGTGRLVPLAVAVLTAGALGLTAASVVEKIAAQDYYGERAAAVAAAIPPPSELDLPAVVFVDDPEGRPYVGQPYPFLRNDPDVQNPVLYAVSRGAPDHRIFSAVPGRTVYELRLPYLRRGTDLRVPEGSFVRLDVVRGAALEVRTSVQAPVTGTCLTAFATTPTGVRSKPVTCDSQAGRTYEVTWRVGPGGEVPVAAQDAVLTTGIVVGPEGSTPDSPDVTIYEERHSIGPAPTAAGQLEMLAPGEPWRGSTGSEPRWEPVPLGGVLQTTVVPAP